VVRDDENGTESAVISLGGGVKKRVTLNTHAVQQKNQVQHDPEEIMDDSLPYCSCY
jgi:deoxyhypusine synthase